MQMGHVWHLFLYRYVHVFRDDDHPSCDGACPLLLIFFCVQKYHENTDIYLHFCRSWACLLCRIYIFAPLRIILDCKIY